MLWRASTVLLICQIQYSHFTAAEMWNIWTLLAQQPLAQQKRHNVFLQANSCFSDSLSSAVAAAANETESCRDSLFLEANPEVGIAPVPFDKNSLWWDFWIGFRIIAEK